MTVPCTMCVLWEKITTFSLSVLRSNTLLVFSLPVQFNRSPYARSHIYQAKSFRIISKPFFLSFFFFPIFNFRLRSDHRIHRMCIIWASSSILLHNIFFSFFSHDDTYYCIGITTIHFSNFRCDYLPFYEYGSRKRKRSPFCWLLFLKFHIICSF